MTEPTPQPGSAGESPPLATWYPPRQHDTATKPWWRRPWLLAVICIVALALATGTLKFTFSDSTSFSPPRDVADDYIHGPGWKRFTATDGQFAATFPTFPIRLSGPAKVGGVTTQNVEYRSDPTPGDSFGVLVATFPREVRMGDPQDFLNNTANAEAARNQGTITETRFRRVQGYPAIDFVVDGAARDLHELLVLADHTQYAVGVIGSASAMSESSRFLSSFHLLDGVRS